MWTLLSSIKNNPDLTPELSKKIARYTDDELAQKCFRIIDDHSGTDRVVMKSFGLTLFRAFYENWEIKINKPLSMKRRLMLARGCSLPYYIDEKKIVVFESHIGVLLTLSQGSVEQAIDGLFILEQNSPT